VPELPASINTASDFSIRPSNDQEDLPTARRIELASVECQAQRKSPTPEPTANALSASGQDVTMTDVPTIATATTATTPEAVAYLSDDDDGMELEEEDFQEQEAKFQKKKANLESRLLDLSSQRYRATTPIATLNKLIGIKAIIKDLHFDPTPSPEPDMASGATEAAASVVESIEAQDDHSIREPSPLLTRDPEITCLPYMHQRPPTPFSDPDASYNQLEQPLHEKLLEIQVDEDEFQDALCDEFASRYAPWKRETLALDKQRDEEEFASTQTQMEVDIVPPLPEIPAAPLATPTLEGGRRSHKFSSQYDIDRVLEESRREEEKRREREEREAKEAQVSTEREAEIYPLLGKMEAGSRMFADISHFRDVEEGLRVFEFAPFADNFTEEEDRKLRIAYANDTKMWSKIADAVGRSAKECIAHYYATKWDKPYKKTQGKKGKKGVPRKGVAGARSNRNEPEQEQQDQILQVTETGRPRRAAAPRFNDKEKLPLSGKGEGEGDLDNMVPGTGKKSANAKTDSGGAEEKAGRRAKTAKEKATRKRNPPLAAKTPAPLKAGKEKKEKAPPPAISAMSTKPVESEDWMVPKRGLRESMIPEERLMPALLPHQQPSFLDPGMVVYGDKPELPVPALPAAHVGERPRSHSQTQRQGASSYWSVAEELDFKTCLGYYGTDFQAIANHMGTKTHTMVNHPL
jgi:hypothetical protein